MEPELDGAAAALYALAPEQFTAAKGELVASARSAGDTGLATVIATLRKPSVAAWAVNLWVRRHPEDVARLQALAARLHEAQEQVDGPLLKRLGRERNTLLDELGARAAATVTAEGQVLSASAAREVRETLTAALATAAAAEAVASGRLTRSLSYAGFGEVDLSGATAGPPPRRRTLRAVPTAPGLPAVPALPARQATPQRTPGPAPELLEQVRDAEHRAREAMAAAADTGSGLAGLVERLATSEERVTALEEQLRRAREERDELRDQRARTQRESRTAEDGVRVALAELDERRSRLPGRGRE